MTELELLKFLLPKIIIATLCGLMIGYERELKHKVAGIRTHILICVGSCLFTVISIVLGQEYHIDPTRIISNIPTGIGFIGAGVIYTQDNKVTGITSAAFIFLIASFGVFIGVGYLIAPILLTVGLIIFLLILEKMENK